MSNYEVRKTGWGTWAVFEHGTDGRSRMVVDCVRRDSAERIANAKRGR